MYFVGYQLWGFTKAFIFNIFIFAASAGICGNCAGYDGLSGAKSVSRWFDPDQLHGAE